MVLDRQLHNMHSIQLRDAPHAFEDNFFAGHNSHRQFDSQQPFWRPGMLNRVFEKCAG